MTNHQKQVGYSLIGLILIQRWAVPSYLGSELHKRVTIVVVISVVSLLFPENSEKTQKLLFWQCQKLLVTIL